jgi:hypothetical protein
MTTNIVCSNLEQGNFVEYSLIHKYLGMEFSECMKKFDLGRFVRWSKVGNGQDVTVAFRKKGCDGLYCLTEQGLVLTKEL